MSYNNFVYEIMAKNYLQIIRDQSTTLIKGYMMETLKEMSSKTKIECPLLKDKCPDNKVKNKQLILNLPQYFTFNINWKEVQPKLIDICRLFLTIPSSFILEKLFDLNNSLSYKTFELTGMICFGDSHYMSFFKRKTPEGFSWINYNDTLIFPISSFKDVIIHCLKMHMHPVMLFYNYSPSGESMFDGAGISSNDEQKILNFCKNFDSQKENIYKKNELTISRLKPSVDFREKSDEFITKYVNNKRKLNDQEEEEYDNQRLESYGIYVDEKDIRISKKPHGNKDDSRLLTQSVDEPQKEAQKIATINQSVEIKNQAMLINSNSHEFHDSPKFKQSYSQFIDNPIIGDEEWICDKCKNMNSIEESHCISNN